jgi:uncharacterized protein
MSAHVFLSHSTADKPVVEELARHLKSGAEMFEKAKLWERFRTKFRNDKLSAMMRDIIGEDTTLGSDKLQTLLLVVLRNATTDSPWPLSNNSSAKIQRP